MFIVQMALITLLTIIMLVSVFANALHWRACARERFLYQPTSGSLRILSVAWSLAIPATAVLFLSGWFPPIGFGFICGTYFAALNLHSLWRRQADRKIHDLGIT